MAKHSHLVLDFETGEISGLALPKDATGSTTPDNLLLAYDANCLVTDSPGDGVYCTGEPVGTQYQVTKVNIDSPIARESIAFALIVSKSSDTDCVIVVAGMVVGLFTSLTPGLRMFVGVDGALQQGPPTRPSSGTRIVQEMGYVVGANVVSVQRRQVTRVLPV